MKLYRHLAWDGIRKNSRLYVPYLLTGVGAVSFFYILVALARLPEGTLPGSGSRSRGIGMRRGITDMGHTLTLLEIGSRGAIALINRSLLLMERLAGLPSTNRIVGRGNGKIRVQVSGKWHGSV